MSMDYLELIKGGDVKEIKAAFEGQKSEFEEAPDTAKAQYTVAEHDIFSETIRPKKTIKKDSGNRTESGEVELVSAQVEVARIGIPFQKIIVERRVGFMLSEPVRVEVLYGDDTPAEAELVDMIERVQNDNKMDYKNKDIARRMMSEMECAEIWYFVENTNPGVKSKFALRVKIVSPQLGDELYPLFDATGDMIAFARAYKIKEEGKEIEHYDIYTMESETKYVEREGAWIIDPDTGAPNPVPNAVGKIMVIYHTQPAPEWADVQSMITRFETLLSNHADTNDYFGSPILAVSGQLEGYASKGETGKILQLESGAQANYLALSSEPNSIKMEMDHLFQYIHNMSQTPDISFDKMMGLGDLSGIALRLMFLDAHMAVKNKEEIFGIGLQRRINLLKAAIGRVMITSMGKMAEQIQIKPILTPYVPENVSEILHDLVLAQNNHILSQETAVELNPLVADNENEMIRLEEDGIKELAGEPGVEQVVPNKIAP